MHPSEAPDGFKLSSKVEATHGAFMYGLESPGEGIFYLLTPDPNDKRQSDVETNKNERVAKASGGLRNVMSRLQDRVVQQVTSVTRSITAKGAKLANIKRDSSKKMQHFSAKMAARQVKMLTSSLKSSRLAVRILS